MAMLMTTQRHQSTINHWYELDGGENLGIGMDGLIVGQDQNSEPAQNLTSWGRRPGWPPLQIEIRTLS